MKPTRCAVSVMLTAAMLISSVCIVPLTVSAAGDEPAFETKQINVYRDSLDTDETMECRFYEDLPGVPYAEFTGWYSQIFDGESAVVETEDHKFSITMLPDNYGAVLDTENDSMIIESFSAFFATPGYSENGVAEQTKKDFPYLEYVSTEYDPQDPTPKTLDFGGHGIDIREDDGKVYFPVATLSDMFSNESYTTVNFNGENLYIYDYLKIENAGNAKNQDENYIDYFLNNDRNAATAQFVYNELCFCIDYWYGFPMDNYEFTNKIKEVRQKMIYRIYGYKEEYHSSVLRIAFEYCDSFGVTLYKDVHKKDLSEKFYSFMQTIGPYESDIQNHILPDYRVAKQQLHIYRLCKNTRRIISEIPSFNEWKCPDLPFDLSFYRNKRAFMWYITMEDLFCVDTDDSKIIDRIEEKGLSLVPLYPGIIIENKGRMQNGSF